MIIEKAMKGWRREGVFKSIQHLNASFNLLSAQKFEEKNGRFDF